MSLRGLTNAHLVSWRGRNGSDEQGRPFYDAEQIARPQPIIANLPTTRHIRLAEREGFAVAMVILVDITLDIQNADRVQIDHPDAAGKGLIVRERKTIDVPGLRGRELMCEWEAGA